MPARLSNASLSSLPSTAERPRYDRSAVRTGIVHFGVGGFHRSHQAMLVDTLMNAGQALDWGICGVGTLPSDRRIAEAMGAQDCLYTLEVKNADGSRDLRVIGSIVEYLLAVDDPEAVIERLADPAVRIVSLTITEGGYFMDDVTGAFDPSAPPVQADLEPGATPRTVFAFIVAGLRRRRDRGIAAFTVMSCDNIQGNGSVARNAVVGFARLLDEDLAAWIDSAVAFPSSMVDRITPVTTDADRSEIRERTGLADDAPVVCEPFWQWALEDDFPSGRPPYEAVGVQMVPDVEPYERMKIRLLNCTHQGMCYFGYLAGYRYAHEAAADPRVAAFLLRYMDEEATPTLLPVPGIDLDRYKRSLIERYRNPEVRDTLARLAAESSDRITKWLLPVVRERLAVDGRIDCAAAIIASWARYDEGVDEAGRPIEVVDRRRDQLMRRAAVRREEPLAFVQDDEVFGSLAQDPRFSRPYLDALESLTTEGALATVARLGPQQPERTSVPTDAVS